MGFRSKLNHLILLSLDKIKGKLKNLKFKICF